MIIFRKLTEKRINFFDRSLGPIVFWWMITFLASLYLPGFNIILAWPLVFSLVPIMWMLLDKNEPTSWKYIIVNSISAIVIIGITVVPVYLLFQVFGVSSPGFSGSPSFPIIGLSMFFWVMLLSLILPQLRIFGDIGRKRIVYSILSIACVSLIVAIILPGINLEMFGLP